MTLCETFSKIFNEKVNKICSSKDDSDVQLSCRISNFDSPYFFSSLVEVNQNDIRSMVAASSSKHSQLNPIPTLVLKMVIKPLILVITSLINKSFQKRS